MQRAGFIVQKTVMAAILLALWYVLSGKFAPLPFGTGIATAIVIALAFRSVPDTTRVNVGRLVVYVPWLLYQIIVSNLRVARSVLMPHMPIRPTFISQPPGVTGDRALTLLGASITLTPGTLTVDIGPDEMFIHALDEYSARDVRDGVIADRVGDIFEEPGT